MNQNRAGQRHHICMIVQDPSVHGGIAAVTSGYYGSRLEQDYRITYVESYCDGSKWTKLKKALRAYRQFRKILREDPPELVHIHASFGPSFYREIPFIRWAVRRGIPVVNHIHGSAFDEFYENASPGKKKRVRKYYGECSRLIVLSGHWKEVLSQVVPEENIAVIPNYSVLHPEVMTPDMKKERFAAQQILYLGVLTEGKGMKEMPAVIRKVAETVPSARFILGGDGDAALVTSGLTPDLLARNVRMPGWVRGEEKEKLLRKSMIFFLPSHMEAMPMSILEAMGYGLPVVSTSTGGIPNLVEDPGTGVLCGVGDTDAMAEAIIRYLTDYSSWEKASEETMKRADSVFGFERHLDRLEEVYREVLNDACHSSHTQAL